MRLLSTTALAALACLYASCTATRHAELAGAAAGPAPACSDCFAPEACAGETRVCPAGPDCFAPEVCADRTMTCPR